MEEIWKAFNKNYAISNYGNIKNTNTRRILKLRKNHKGYLKTNISNCGKIKTVFPHRLVAEAFIENPNNLSHVNHKDENKQNNVFSNLEWCTNIYNANYGTSKQRISEKLRKDVYQYDLTDNLIKKFKSTREAAKAIGGNSGGISKACNGKTKTYKGFIWRY